MLASATGAIASVSSIDAFCLISTLVIRFSPPMSVCSLAAVLPDESVDGVERDAELLQRPAEVAALVGQLGRDLRPAAG